MQQLLAADRSNEEAHAALMRLYALTGQRQQALRQYQVLRAALQEELDAEPEEGTIRLYETIQSGRLAASIPEANRDRRETLRSGVVSALPRPAAPAELRSEDGLLSPPRKLHNLPYRVSSFIGREKEIDQVIELSISAETTSTRLATTWTVFTAPTSSTPTRTPACKTATWTLSRICALTAPFRRAAATRPSTRT